MTVYELLDEIKEIIETASGVPLTGKILIDGDEIQDIVKEIRDALPEEIQQARWIKEERERILNEAKQEYEIVLSDAKQQSAAMVEEHEIMQRAKNAAADLTRENRDYVRNMKLNCYEYIDRILFDFHEKMEHMNAIYFGDMFTSLQKTFEGIGQAVHENRQEIKDLYRTTDEDE